MIGKLIAALAIMPLAMTGMSVLADDPDGKKCPATDESVCPVANGQATDNGTCEQTDSPAAECGKPCSVGVEGCLEAICQWCPVQVATGTDDDQKNSAPIKRHSTVICLGPQSAHPKIPFFSHLPCLKNVGFSIGDKPPCQAREQGCCVAFEIDIASSEVRQCDHTGSDPGSPCPACPAADHEHSSHDVKVVEYSLGDGQGINFEFAIAVDNDQQGQRCQEKQCPACPALAEGDHPCPPRTAGHGRPAGPHPPAPPVVTNPFMPVHLPGTPHHAGPLNRNPQPPHYHDPQHMAHLMAEIGILKAREELTHKFMAEREHMREQLFEARMEIAELHARHRILEEREQMVQELVKLQTRHSRMAAHVELNRLQVENEALRAEVHSLSTRHRSEPGRTARQPLPPAQGR